MNIFGISWNWLTLSQIDLTKKIYFKLSNISTGKIPQSAKMVSYESAKVGVPAAGELDRFPMLGCGYVS